MKKTKKDIRNVWLVAIVFVVTALLGLMYLEKMRVTDVLKDPFYKPAQKLLPDAQQQQNLDKKEAVINQPSPTDTAGSREPESLEISVARDSSSVIITSKLSHVAGGICKLEITNAPKSYIVESVPVIYNPEFSSCAGYDVPVEKLGSGTWKIRITVQTNSGSSLIKEYSYEVMG